MRIYIDESGNLGGIGSKISEEDRRGGGGIALRSLHHRWEGRGEDAERDGAGRSPVPGKARRRDRIEAFEVTQHPTGDRPIRDEDEAVA